MVAFSKVQMLVGFFATVNDVHARTFVKNWHESRGNLLRDPDANKVAGEDDFETTKIYGDEKRALASFGNRAGDLVSGTLGVAGRIVGGIGEGVDKSLSKVFGGNAMDGKAYQDREILGKIGYGIWNPVKGVLRAVGHIGKGGTAAVEGLTTAGTGVVKALKGTNAEGAYENMRDAIYEHHQKMERIILSLPGDGRRQNMLGLMQQLETAFKNYGSKPLWRMEADKFWKETMKFKASPLYRGGAVN